MSKGRMVNGYWIHKISATISGSPQHWRVTRPDGTEVGKYPTYAAAAQAALGFLPG